MDNVSSRLKETARHSDDSHKSLSRTSDKVKGLGDALEKMLKPLKGVLKGLKYLGYEFAAMVAVMAGIKLAFVAGQYAVKLYHASLVGLGAAAGIAIGALSGVMAAMRELQVAQARPLYKSVYGDEKKAFSPEALISSVMGDKRLGMFDAKSLNAAMSAYLQKGLQAPTANQLARFGDFTGGDAKSLTSIASAMATAQKTGKVTAETYKEFQKTAPGLAKAFEEMAGGEKAAESATIAFDKFNAAIQEGKLKALEPYKGALDEINNTLIGKFKGGLAALKEQITRIGSVSWGELYGADSPFGASTGEGINTSILQAMKAPLDQLVVSIQASLNAIAPTLQRLLPQWIVGINGPMEAMLTKFTQVVVAGMERMDGFTAKLNYWIGIVRGAFTSMGAWMEPYTHVWDELWNDLLRPVTEGLLSLLNGLLEKSAEAFSGNSVQIAYWGENLKGILEDLSIFGDFLKGLKKVLSPVITLVLQTVKIFTSLLNLPIIKQITSWGLVFLLLHRSVHKIGIVITRLVVALNRWATGQAKVTAAAETTTAAVAAENATLAQQAALVNGRGMGRGLLAKGRGVLGNREMRTSMAGYGAVMLGSSVSNMDKRAGSAVTGIGEGLVVASLFDVSKGATGAMVAGQTLSYLAGSMPDNSRGGAKTNTAQQVIAGLASGAGLGAMVASAIPIPGISTAIGAAVGGAIGAGMGFMNARSAQQAERERSQVQGKKYINRQTPGGPQTLKELETQQRRAGKLMGAVERMNQLERSNGWSWLGGLYIGDTGKTSPFWRPGGKFGLISDKQKELARMDPKSDAAKALSKEIKDLQFQRDYMNATILKNYGSVSGAKDAAKKARDTYARRKAVLTVNESIGDLFGLAPEKLAEFARRHKMDLSETKLGIESMLKMFEYSGRLSKGMIRAADLAVMADKAYRNFTENASKTKETAQAGVEAVNAIDQYLKESKAGGMSADQMVVSSATVVEAIGKDNSAQLAAGKYASYDDFVNKSKTELLMLVQEMQNQGVGQPAIDALVAQIVPVFTKLDASVSSFGARMDADAGFAARVNTLVRGKSNEFNELDPAAQVGKKGTEIVQGGAEAIKKTLETEFPGLKLDPTDVAGLEGLIRGTAENGANGISNALVLGGAAVGQQISAAFRNAKLNFLVKVNGATAGSITVQGVGGGKDDGHGDTTTARFGQTMARHAAINRMVPGNRTITSGMRNTNLGSINSDHLTGNAYDLTGANLGAYAGIVRAQGGFAEMHGGALNRHLHVVPGLGGPMGDTASPMVRMGGVAGGVINNFSIVVNASAGQSESAIADEVMARIERRAREAAERR